MQYVHRLKIDCPVCSSTLVLGNDDPQMDKIVPATCRKGHSVGLSFAIRQDGVLSAFANSAKTLA